jgi:hypothetical protein
MIELHNNICTRDLTEKNGTAVIFKVTATSYVLISLQIKLDKVFLCMSCRDY